MHLFTYNRLYIYIGNENKPFSSLMQSLFLFFCFAMEIMLSAFVNCMCKLRLVRSN